jgi:hypothetical protein
MRAIETAALVCSGVTLLGLVGGCAYRWRRYFPEPWLRRLGWLGEWIRRHWLHAALVALYVAAHTLFLVTSSLGLLPPTSLDSLLPQLAMGNMVPLFLGGRTNPLAHFLRIDRGNYYRVHRWAALMALGEGTAHAIMAWPGGDGSQRLSGGLLLGGIGLGCVTPLALALGSGWLRMFPKLHLGASIGAAAALVFHIWARRVSSFDVAWILLCCGGSLWAISTVVRIVRGWRHGGNAEAWSVGKRDTDYEAVRVKVQMRHPMATRPGNYFYLFLPGLRHRLQSRAAPVAWWDPSEREVTRNVTFLLEKRWASRLLQTPTPVVDGPYGRDFGFEGYEKVVLLADGAGIAGVLPFAVSMMSRKHVEWEAGSAIDKSHKLFLFWELDDPSQGEWVMDLFEELHRVNVTKVRSRRRHLLPL